MIKVKRHRYSGKCWHQVFLDGRCVGAIQRHGYMWVVCRVHGWGIYARSKRDAIQKLLEYKGILA